MLFQFWRHELYFATLKHARKLKLDKLVPILDINRNYQLSSLSDFVTCSVHLTYLNFGTLYIHRLCLSNFVNCSKRFLYLEKGNVSQH